MGEQAAGRVHITSAIRGRIRLRLAGGRHAACFLEPLRDRIRAIDGIAEVEVVREASSVVVRYPPAARDLASLIREIESACGSGTSSSRGALPVPPPRRDRLPRSPSSSRSSHSPRPVPPSTLEQDSRPIARSTPGISVVHDIPGRLRLHIPRFGKREGIAEHVENGLAGHEGISDVEAMPREEFLIVHYDARRHKPRAILRRVEDAVRSAWQQEMERQARGEPLRMRDVAPEDPPQLHPLIAPTVALALAALEAPALVVGGVLAIAAVPIGRRAVQGVRDRRFNVDQLDLAALGVLGLQGNFVVGGLMTWLVSLGEYIRARTARRSCRTLSDLMAPENQTAWVERDGSRISVPVSEVAQGEIVYVYPGDQIPVDGQITEGRALIDQKTLTGEPDAVTRGPGDEAFALTMVEDGALAIRVSHIGRETRVGRVIQLVESAPLSDTRIQNYASAIGDRMVGPIFGLAGAVYLLTADPMRAAAVLILDFVTGIRVSAPTTILSAMSGAARQGVFIKGGRALEELARVDAVVFDKTGTLTCGEPEVSSVNLLDGNLDESAMLRLAACAEANMRHPAARAVVDAARARNLLLAEPEDVQYTLGMGVAAEVEGRRIVVGSQAFIRKSGIETAVASEMAIREHESGRSVVYVAVDGRLSGLIVYSDPPRPESAGVVRALRDRGVRRIVMLTGDNPRPADRIARGLGITDVIAEAFPERKAEVVRDLRGQGMTVAVVGDGINDSAAFAEANVGISLSHGADAAKETADVILLDGDLTRLPDALDLSRYTMGVMRQNVNIIVGPTAIGLAAAVLGLASPFVSTLINNGVTVLAGINALRPLYAQWREPDAKSPCGIRIHEDTRRHTKSELPSAA